MTPESITFPLTIKNHCINVLDVCGAHGDPVFSVMSNADDVTEEDWEITRWIVATLNKAANDS